MACEDAFGSSRLQRAADPQPHPGDLVPGRPHHAFLPPARPGLVDIVNALEANPKAARTSQRASTQPWNCSETHYKAVQESSPAS